MWINKDELKLCVDKNITVHITPVFISLTCKQSPRMILRFNFSIFILQSYLVLGVNEQTEKTSGIFDIKIEDILAIQCCYRV